MEERCLKERVCVWKRGVPTASGAHLEGGAHVAAEDEPAVPPKLSDAVDLVPPLLALLQVDRERVLPPRRQQEGGRDGEQRPRVGVRVGVRVRVRVRVGVEERGRG